MSFALCLYYSSETRQLSTPPKVLLFDEIDAPLHPSMSRQLLSTITKTLVGQQNISVIMTTHSPSTVAVAAEEAVYMMEPDVPGIRKTSRSRAISALTVEIPALSISFDGRRQVFVESRDDAERYDLLYRNLRGRLDSERSLVFIGVGRRPESGGDQNAGSSQVTSTVNALAAAGNTSVFGLLDWDTKHQATHRVHVLAQDERYAIENCLLDPLLVGAVVHREKRDADLVQGFTADESVADMRTFSPERLQAISDGVQAKLLDVGSVQPGDRVVVRYLGGSELKVARQLLQMNGHQLEQRVRAAYPVLRRFHQDGALLRHVIEPVLVELPYLIPAVLVETLRRLLDAEVG